MTERRNHYRILGVQPDAGPAVIRMAWRTAMQKLGIHPDLGGDPVLATAINVAYQVLSDPQQRAQYDRELLRHWDMAELAGHRCIPAAGDKPAGSGNRRNYYRVLGIQPDAPPAVIRAAYRVRLADEGVDSGLVEEAYAVLGDETERRRYDDWLNDTAPEPVPTETGLRIESYCHFCRAPHLEYPHVPTGRCHACGSPLSSDREYDPEAARQFARQACRAPLELWRNWPTRIVNASVQDLTPAGLAASVAEPLPPDEVVRLRGEGIDAVARVVRCAPAGPGYRCGLQFLAVRFTAAGVLVDTAW